MRRFISQDRELCAGAAFVPAGYSSGRSVCARGRTVGAIRNAECAIRNFGNELIRRCGSIAVFRVWFTPAVRFCWNVLRSVHACHAVLLGCLAFGSRLPCGSVGMSGVRFTPVSFPLSGKERRLAVSCVPIPPWVGIAFRAFSNCRAVIGLCGFTSGLSVSLWRSRRGCRGRWGRETGLRRNEAGGAAFVRLCAGALALQVFPRGVRWGLRAPDCAKESKVEAALRPLWTLFFWVAAWVRFTRGGLVRITRAQIDFALS